MPLFPRVKTSSLPQTEKGVSRTGCEQPEILAGSMMFTVVEVSSFSILWYTWSSIYMSSYNTPSFSLVLCWSLIVSLPGLSWHQGLLLAQQCCPRSDRPLPYSWCSQSFCSHKGESKVTQPHLKKSETMPRQTHTCADTLHCQISPAPSAFYQ